jgi:hypothetical protein
LWKWLSVSWEADSVVSRVDSDPSFTKVSVNLDVGVVDLEEIGKSCWVYWVAKHDEWVWVLFDYKGVAEAAKASQRKEGEESHLG